jgi:hypothetical protein
MSRIVTTHYRYKRTPRKSKTVTLEGPAVVKASETEPFVTAADEASGPTEGHVSDAATARPVIITARPPGAKDLPDMTPEEHQRRGDAADALFRKVTKAAAGPASRDRGPRWGE